MEAVRGEPEEAEPGEGEINQGECPALVGRTAGEGADGVHHGGEVRRNRPGSPGVL